MDIRRRPPNPSVKVANLEYAIPHDDSEPRNILEKIVWEKDREIQLARQRVPLENLQSQISSLPSTKDFLSSLKNANSIPAVIAEIKKASPSKGIIRENFDPVAIAKGYEIGGAACLSVLTDKSFFQGGFEFLIEVRKAVELPLLCKDFIISPYQLYQARAAGADAILFIAAILSDEDLTYLSKVASSLDLSILVEVHNSLELERVLSLNKFNLIGINNRDLKSFKTDLGITHSLLTKFGDRLKERGILVVSESGLFQREDLDSVSVWGANAVLVGESLMRQEDVASGLKKLISRK